MFTPERRTELENALLKYKWHFTDCNLAEHQEGWVGLVSLTIMINGERLACITAIRDSFTPDRGSELLCEHGIVVKPEADPEWNYEVVCCGVTWKTKNPAIIAKINELIQTKLWNDSSSILRMASANGSA